MKMTKLMGSAIGAFALAAVSGCATTYRVTELPSPPVPQPATPVAQPAVIAVSAKPQDAGAARLASALGGAVESRIAARGMTVASPLPPNATVQIDVSRRETARLNEWRTYEGTARVRVMTTVPSERLLSETTVQAAGDRALDEVKAEQGVLDGLTRKVNAWIDATVTPQRIPVLAPVPPPAAYQTARILFAPVDVLADPREMLDAQVAFREAVASVDGIVSCRLSADGGQSPGAIFDIAYDQAKFPDGLINTLVVRLRERGGLERFRLLFRSKGLDIVL